MTGADPYDSYDTEEDSSADESDSMQVDTKVQKKVQKIFLIFFF